MQHSDQATKNWANYDSIMVNQTLAGKNTHRKLRTNFLKNSKMEE